MNNELYKISVDKIDRSKTTLGAYENKVLLIVNVASKCGLTPQYEGLEKLYEKYQSLGFEVLGFPANEFLAQEPGTNEEIEEFCKMKFGIKFPMFSKIVVKGEGQHPLYSYLTKIMPKAELKAGGQLLSKLADKGLLTGAEHDIKWNFEKFLVDRKGKVIARFSPDIAADDPVLISAVESALKN